MQPIVYILDDDEGARASLSWLVASVGLSAKCFGSAAEFLSGFDPDCAACLVLDVRMPEVGGFEVQELLRGRKSHMPIIFVSGHGDIPMSVRAMKNGAFDFVEKPYNSQAMLERIQEAVRAATAQYEKAKKRKALEQRLALLSPREREVLRRVVDGKTSKMIARELQITAKTVDLHRTSIHEKLGSTSVASLVREVLLHFGRDI
ncbi:MAG TPA: response regulator [Steroidobacteraceae bacterium]|jgi:RNA polymerase sigma factor (sigma-70 family)|nr:response regulator [Steroidobacteraceae bacterium]